MFLVEAFLGEDLLVSRRCWRGCLGRRIPPALRLLAISTRTCHTWHQLLDSSHEGCLVARHVRQCRHLRHLREMWEILELHSNRLLELLELVDLLLELLLESSHCCSRWCKFLLHFTSLLAAKIGSLTILPEATRSSHAQVGILIGILILEISRCVLWALLARIR